MTNSHVLKLFRVAVAVQAFVMLVTSSVCFASGSWRVSPIRLDFEQNTRSGVVTITNDGDAAVNLQVKAVLWTQDGQGKDVYDETKDLVFFPRIMTINPGDNRVLRAGVQFPATTLEKTYRLFVEEIPEPRKDSGAVVAIAIRFGIPVFISPLKAQVSNEISGIAYKNDALHFTLKNAGNIHYRILKITVSGKDDQGLELWKAESEGWYLLAGAQRDQVVKFSIDDCRRSTLLNLLVHTDKGDFTDQFRIDPTQCLP